MNRVIFTIFSFVFLTSSLFSESTQEMSGKELILAKKKKDDCGCGCGGKKKDN